MLCVLRPDPADRLQQLTSAAANKCPGNYREIRLHELSPEQNRQMIASLLKVEALSLTIRDWILARTQGNPFFTEEVVRALIDAGIIVRGESGWHSSRQEDDESAADTVPYNIDSLIHSRVDRLDPDSRRHLQIAAALGHTFSLPILERLVDDPAVLADHLKLFQRRGFIYLERSGPD